MDRFDSDYFRYPHNCPILSDELAQGRFKEKYQIVEGTEMIFFYDEGSPTRVLLSIDKIEDAPTSSEEIAQYPMRIPLACEIPKRSSTDPVESKSEMTMDEALPNLVNRLDEYQPCFEFGQGFRSCGSGDYKSKWAVIWGGEQLAFRSSMECFSRFNDVDEAFWCFEKGIEMQMNPTGEYDSASCSAIVVRSLLTGEVSRRLLPLRGSEDDILRVHVCCYPQSAPKADYLSEYVSGLCPEMNYHFGSKMFKNEEGMTVETLVRTEMHWRFNFHCQMDGGKN